LSDAVTKRGAGFRSLGQLPFAEGNLGGHHQPAGRLVLTVLGSLAEFERELIRARTPEGRKRVKERGVRFGRLS
jgi:DNA invertase Pin-like site-specific DNA recombinase